ncbi:MAG: PTS sugar transporter subunit IIC [Coprobacillaceae bacterium]
MDLIMNKIEKLLMPIANRIGANRYLMALRDGMVASMPMMMIGSIILVVAELPIDGYQAFMANTFGEGWKWFSDAATSATIGLAAIFAIIGIANSLAVNRKKDTVMASIIALSAYFTVLVQIEGGGFSVRDFGARGLFAAMIIAMISTEIYCFIVEKDITIKMPSSVPPAVSRSFEALIPAAIVIPIFLLVRFVFAQTSFESLNNFILNMLQTPLTGVTTTFWGIMLSAFLSHFLWFFGMHGASIVGAVFGPMLTVAGLENLEAFQAGAPLPNIVTQQFNDIFQTFGGVGSTLALAFLMAFFCKSKQLKTLGCLAVVPGIFGINEPLVFGLPLVLNPFLAIPFFITPLINLTLAYFATSLGIIGTTTGVAVTWSMPPFLSGILGTNTLSAGILQVVAILISLLIYYPFIKSYDRKMVLEEQEALINED